VVTGTDGMQHLVGPRAPVIADIGVNEVDECTPAEVARVRRGGKRKHN
jgi:hypothetical protein